MRASSGQAHPTIRAILTGCCMTRQLAKPQPSHERVSDAFVILSVTILSLASGAWLISNLGLELSSALLASLAIYCVLLLVHLLVRRAFAERDSREDFL